MPPVGPFSSEREAQETPAVRAIYAAFRASRGAGRMAAHVHRMLISACVAASVGPGAFDTRVPLWLSGWEPETCAVVAGLISRAYEAGRTRSGNNELTL